MAEILGKQVTDEEWDYFMTQQATHDKEIKIINDKVVAVDHEITQEELLMNELNSLYSWFEEYDNQVKQYERCKRLGIEFDKNINELDTQATINQQRITEIRKILKTEV